MDDLDLDDEAQAGDGAAWMATFADMMTLLLCFFILLLSFATMDVQKFRDAMGSIQEALGVQFEHDGEFEAIASSPLQLDSEEGNGAIGEDRALLDELTAAIAEEGLDDQIGAEIDGRGVVVRIDGQVLYPLGNAELKPEANPILTRIAALVRGTSHRVMIEGHTDDIPIRTARYPSNWELSTARAIAAMRFMVNENVPAERVGVAGYADLRPLEPNESEAQRAANRRVEFVFIRETAPEDSPQVAEAESTEPGDEPQDGEGATADSRALAEEIEAEQAPANAGL